MRIIDFFRSTKAKPQTRSVRWLASDGWQECISGGFTALDQNPEVVAGCFKIAQLIASMTIYLMANTEKGDKRVVNALSRKIDIEPNKLMTRNNWMTAIVMNLLLYGNGNSIVIPHTKGGILEDLEPVEAHRVQLMAIQGKQDYRVVIDGKTYNPEDILHFVYNPDKYNFWKGQGLTTTLETVTRNIAQARETEKAFMNSKWKPSIVVKIDAQSEDFDSPDKRRRFLDTYVSSSEAGEPWLVPSNEFAVEQVRPLSLADLAINDTVKIDKQTVASILGVPAFVLGVGDFKADEWIHFINTKIMPIAQIIEQEMTRKLIISPKMYIKFNAFKLYSYDIEKLSRVFSDLYVKGLQAGDDVLDKLGLEPKGLDKLVMLENYIPADQIGDQKKLKQGD